MANEKDSTNRPPKRFRAFSLITYCNIEQVKIVLLRHDKQVRSYAFIVHDKDLTEDGKPKEKHIHLLIRLVNNTTVEAVRNWFKGFVDDNGMLCNTLAQPMHDTVSSFEYLTHSTEQAIAEGKFQYCTDDIYSNDIEFWKDSSKQDEDNISLALAELLSGVPLVTVSLKYGRDFIIHYQSIKILMKDIIEQTGGLI